MEPSTPDQKLNHLVARCWADAAFKARLLADPVAVLREVGIEVSPGIALRVLEDTAQTVHLVIPARPAELTDEALADVAGGFADALLNPKEPVQRPFLPMPGYWIRI